MKLMYSAVEAREKAKRHNDRKPFRQRRNIINTINRGCRRGETSWHFDEIDAVTKQELEDAGYSVHKISSIWPSDGYWEVSC